MAAGTPSPVEGSRRRPAGALAAACLLVVVATVGCAARREIPPGPTLPEVRFVPPSDPDAVIALTGEDEKALVMRDRLLRQRIDQLKALLNEDR